MSNRLLGRLGAFATTVALTYILTSRWPEPPASSVLPSTYPIQMVLNDVTYRFDPSEIIAHAGDHLRFENASGGPHNVAFYGDALSEPVARLLDEALGEKRIGPLMSHLLVDPREILEVTIPALPPGRYRFTCLAHMAMGMNGVLVVHR